MDILIIGTFWFWALIVISFILITWSVECDNAISATIMMLVTFTLLYFLGGKDFKSTILSILGHPIKLLMAIFTYLLTGTIWSIVKWYFFLMNKKRKIIEERDRYWNVPQVGEHKSRIITWMAYWPFSMIWTLINDPIKRAFREIYNHISNFMQSISNRVFKSLVDEKEQA
jgi:hypothetical protein